VVRLPRRWGVIGQGRGRVAISRSVECNKVVFPYNGQAIYTVGLFIYIFPRCCRDCRSKSSSALTPTRASRFCPDVVDHQRLWAALQQTPLNRWHVPEGGRPPLTLHRRLEQDFENPYAEGPDAPREEVAARHRRGILAPGQSTTNQSCRHGLRKSFFGSLLALVR
jgi:hypothetical protein